MTQISQPTQAEPVADRIRHMNESQTIAMSQKARELAASGKEVINLSLGEPDFATPDHIREAAKQAIDDGYSFYPPVPGFADLRTAIAEKFRRDNQLDFTPEQIVVSTGAKQSLANVFLSMINPGDEVVILAPYWVSYAELVKLAEGVPVYVYGTLENDFKATAEQVAAAITPRTRAVLFSSPCNPTGAVFSRDELTAIAEAVARHEGVYVVADEIYEYINFTREHFSIGAVPALRDRVVTVNGLSKGFAMTGWRLGYMGGPLWLAKACNKIQGQITSGANAITQRAAIAALTGDLEPTRQMAAAFRRRRDLTMHLVGDIPGIKSYLPEGAFYLFPDVSSYFGKQADGEMVRDANDLSMWLLKNALVATVPGEAFGVPACIRISYATSDEQLRKGIKRMRKALERLC